MRARPARLIETGNVNKILVGKSEGMRPHGKCVYCIHAAQDRDRQRALLNLGVQQKAGDLTSYTTISFSRRELSLH